MLTLTLSENGTVIDEWTTEKSNVLNDPNYMFDREIFEQLRKALNGSPNIIAGDAIDLELDTSELIQTTPEDIEGVLSIKNTK